MQFSVSFGNLGALAFAGRCLVADRYMSCHARVAGRDRDQLDERLRFLIFSYLRIVAGGTLAAAATGLWPAWLHFRGASISPLPVPLPGIVVGAFTPWRTTRQKRKGATDAPAAQTGFLPALVVRAPVLWLLAA